MTIDRKDLLLVLSSILLIGIVGGLLYLNSFLLPTFYNSNQPQNREQQEIMPAYNLTLFINYGNGTVEKHFSLNLTEIPNITVFDLLLKVAVVNYSWYGDAVFVDAINGVFNNENNNNRWWQYWVDGELPMLAANQYYLKNNSLVEWKYWSPQVENQTQTAI